MYHFFVKKEQVEEAKIRILGEDVRHMKNVLRLRIGERVGISAGDGVQYECEIISFEADQVLLGICGRREDSHELRSRIHLYQGMPKGDKLEWIIQKAVELGAWEIIPMITSRTIVKLDSGKINKKVQRWNAISESAAKQSGRDTIPAVGSPCSFSEVLAAVGACDWVLIPYEHATGIDWTRALCARMEPGQSVAVLIGPEGGFSEKEIAQAVEAGACPITLGRRILRTETAALAILATLMLQLET